MFRNLIILAIAVGAASTAGWFTINREGEQTTIQINRNEIRSDARRAIDRGREFLDQREQRLAEQSMNGPTTGQAVGWNDGYEQPNYPQPGYSQQNYPPANYPQQSYPAQNYPAQTYPAQTYPDQTYPGQNYFPPSSQPESNHRVPYREAGYQYGREAYPSRDSGRYQP